jgi:hypothetical protein
VEAGKLEAYDQFRGSVITNFGKPGNYVVSAIVIKSCLLAPAEPSILEGLKPFAEVVTAKLGSRSTGDMDAEQGAFAAMSMALLEYRKGNFSSAQDWCRKTLDFPDTNNARAATVRAIAAMAAYNVGQWDAAHSELALAHKASKMISTPDPTTIKGWGRVFWQDGAIARVLIKEAENLKEENSF